MKESVFPTSVTKGITVNQLARIIFGAAYLIGGREAPIDAIAATVNKLADLTVGKD